MNNILSSRVKCCIDEKVSELIYTKCSGNIAYAIQLFDNWIQYGYLMFQKQNLTETPKAEEEQKEQKEEKEDKEEKKEKKKDIKEKNELQTVVVFVEGVENGTLTLPSQMVDLYKRKMDRFVQTTKMAARLLSVVGVSLTLNDVIDMNEKINLVTMPGKYNTKSEMESGASRIWKALVVDISITFSFFKPVSLSSSRIFFILKHPKQVHFLTQYKYIFEHLFTHTLFTNL